MTSPLRITFDVNCSADHAFATWTSRIDAWWPLDHTLTGRNDVQVVFETGVGGRIYERTDAGTEHDWGVVTVWDPPARLGYLWHLGRDRSHATEVDIRFTSKHTAGTRIEVEHSGWELLGETAEVWRSRNRAGWETLLPHFTAELAKGDR